MYINPHQIVLSSCLKPGLNKINNDKGRVTGKKTTVIIAKVNLKTSLSNFSMTFDSKISIPLSIIKKHNKTAYDFKILAFSS